MTDEINYLRQRIDQEVAMAAAAADPIVKHAHTALAEAFDAKLKFAQGEQNVTPPKTLK